LKTLADRKNEPGLNSFLKAAKLAVRKAGKSVEMMSASAITMDVISVGVAPTSSLAELAGNPEDMVVGVYIEVLGDLPGHAMLIFGFDSATSLVDVIIGQKPGTTKYMDEMEMSVIQEVGNIVTSSYLNTLADFYGCAMLPSPPSLAMDMAGAIIDSILINTGHYDDDTINIVTRFAGKSQAVKGVFLYIPEIVLPSEEVSRS